MSGIGPCLIFLFLAPIIFVALIAFDSAKKMKPEQDNSSILIILEQLSFLALVLLPKQMLMLCLL